MFFRRNKPPPEPELDEDGRPIVKQWSREHLQRLCAESPRFQIMTVDGLHWIEPFGLQLVEAAFDWQEAAVEWMLAHRPWRKHSKPQQTVAVVSKRWLHFLKQHAGENRDLRRFLPNGHWLNPLSGTWVPGFPRKQKQITPEVLQLMANAMAQHERQHGTSTIIGHLELERIYDKAVAQIRASAESSARLNAPPSPPAPDPLEHDGGMRIKKTPSQRSIVANPISETTEHAPHPSGAETSFIAELEAAGYRVGSCLGHGGMATVYLAMQISLQRQVALKVHRQQSDAERSRFAERFLQEARMAARVSHPNVATIYDVGHTPSSVYMAMEYMSGGDLEQQLRRVERFNSIEALRCLCDILRGLSAIHEHGLIHRDIKTANCFIANDSRITIGDLGIARDIEVHEHLTNPRSVVGTPAFMAPEQTKPGADLDGRCDIYAAGMVAFHLISGKIPFNGENSLTILRQVIDSPTPDIRDYRSSTDPRIAAILLRLMAYDAQQRPATALDALDEVQRLMSSLERA